MKKFTDEEISDIKVGILILVFGNVIVDLLHWQMRQSELYKIE